MDEKLCSKSASMHQALSRVKRQKPWICSTPELIDRSQHKVIADKDPDHNGLSTSADDRQPLSEKFRSRKRNRVYPSEKQEVKCAVSDAVADKGTKFYRSPYFIAATALVIGLIIIGIIIGIVFSMSKPTTTTNGSSSTQATSSHVCDTRNSTSCSTPMYYNLNVGYNSPSGWTWISCCYLAPTTNQLTIEFALQEDSGSWLIDDASATQGNGELILNGDFESNFSNWTLVVYSNATSSIAVDSISGSQHSGSAYLYGVSVNAMSYVKQTFSIIRGRNVLIGFWLNYLQAFGFPSGKSELMVTIT